MTLKSSGRLRKLFIYSTILLSLTIIITAAINIRGPAPTKPVPSKPDSDTNKLTDLDAGDDWTEPVTESVKLAIELARGSEDAIWSLTLLALQVV